MSKKTIDVPTLTDSEEKFPTYSSEGAAGADVKASLSEEKIIRPGESALIPTGLRFEIPSGYEIQVRPRSGLALKNQVTVLNTPGTIDEDYRGEVCVILINHGKVDFVVKPGMRIAQIVLSQVTRARWVRKEQLTVSVRGEGGFGHTGVH